jgi:hypothetical protein
MDRPDRVIILGGGWSVRDQKVDVSILQKYGYVIGVNDAGIAAPVDVIVSMDRLWMKNRYEQLAALRRPVMLRESAWRVNMKGSKTWPGFGLFDNDYKTGIMSEDPKRLNGCNSGFCALNLAYQLDPKEVYLFGFDHCVHPGGKSPYWYQPYDWSPESGNKKRKYQDWCQMYAPAAEQFRKKSILVTNVSPASRLTNFIKISYEEFLNTCAPSR